MPWEKIVYGRIPMMLTANCLLCTAKRCRKKNKASAWGEKGDGAMTESGGKTLALLKDRYGREFPVLVNCSNCINIIYNSVPYSLRQELKGWEGNAVLRMDFTLEDGKETEKILDSFIGGEPFPLGEYTTGHEKRGVE